MRNDSIGDRLERAGVWLGLAMIVTQFWVRAIGAILT